MDVFCCLFEFGHTLHRLSLQTEWATPLVSSRFSTYITMSVSSVLPSLWQLSDEMTPKEIVNYLNKHIVGQSDAKRAIAIAMRNRWRRMQLASPLKDEVMPKNILMIGPTGVGKVRLPF